MLTKAGRNAATNNAQIGLIDPFVVKLTIPLTGAAANWEIETDFSTSAKSYITDIRIGHNNVKGHLAATPAAFALVAANNPPLHGFSFSPDHDTQSKLTVGQQIGSIQQGATNARNHIGLDAVAKLAAEGARFEPVRQLGTSLKISSVFFTINTNTNVVKALDFRLLYQNWGRWFGRAYGITAAQVKAQVLAHGTALDRTISLNSSYDLDAATPARNRAAHYAARKRHFEGRIQRLKDEKANFAGGGRRGKKKTPSYTEFQQRKKSSDSIRRERSKAV